MVLFFGNSLLCYSFYREKELRKQRQREEKEAADAKERERLQKKQDEMNAIQMVTSRNKVTTLLTGMFSKRGDNQIILFYSVEGVQPFP